jgi:hypothetical protein
MLEQDAYMQDTLERSSAEMQPPIKPKVHKPKVLLASIPTPKHPVLFCSSHSSAVTLAFFVSKLQWSCIGTHYRALLVGG